ncbi:SusF/SusE family outer membrane protein [Cecembia sp.]|uniref:SusF/SusE family outer membrane protein n=1 Tax=Cecembia sp. TaxID=1898110 RepID=UPI0025B99F2E|nr:SusF/SusE family outer membrane protein [Cecembia sp.]
MMKFLTKLTWAAFLLPLIWACGDLEQPPIIQQFPASISSPPSAIVLTGEDEDEVVVFNVTQADFGANMEVTYIIQMDRPGNGFENAADLGSSTSNVIEVKANEINRRAISRGIVAGETGPMEFRVRAVPSRTLSALAGEPVTISVTTFSDAVALRNMFLVGEATARGWDNNANNPALFRDPENADLFVYSGFFNAGGFKVLENLGQWQPQFGTNDGSTISANMGGGDDPDVFNVPAAGYYTFTFDLSTETFSLEPIADVPSVFETVGIIGSATPEGWDASTAMNQLEFDQHIYYITASLEDGEMKFRADNDWAVNWGAGTAISGAGVQDGPNIPVEAGTFKIWFNSLDGRYLKIEQ